MYKSIAITGISFELPGMKDWAELSQSLSKKEIKVGVMPPGRLQDFHNHYGHVEMSTGGFLEHIDLFDHTYFGLTEREAVKTFPEQRLFLSHAMRAFYDAGYTEKDLQQSDTGIFLASARSQYHPYLNGQYDFFDTLTGIEATRLARFLDIRGPVMSINTTCSSSLMAVHSACSSLEHGECGMALVGGVRLSTITKERADGFVVISRRGECRPFDKDADGMMNGEGVICMVLKRLEDAERDNDPIYATIEGRAVNHGGARITSLTAPSIEAQKEVILKAWEHADIAPKDVKFIEAHGTGTILGDPIEFAGINEAFLEKGISAATCKISSVKAQIGHLDTMCGMAGLLRIVAALNNKIIPPQANFTTINEHIEEAGSAIEIQREPEYWKTDDGRRTGGVSSFGLTGTNVHMVIANREKEIQEENQEQYHFLQISETTQDKLEKLKLQLTVFLEDDLSLSLGVFSQKINRLYNAGKYHEGIVFTDRNDLLTQLRTSVNKPAGETAFLLMDLDLLSYDRDHIRQILKENSIIKKCWEDAIGKAYSQEQITDHRVLGILFQYVLYKYLLSLLGNKLQVIAKQGEGVLQALLNNKLEPVAIINDPGLIIINDRHFNRQSFEDYLFKNFAQQKVVLIDFSRDNEMHFPDAGNIMNIGGAFYTKERCQLYKELLEAGKEPLRASNVGIPLPGIQLPVYQLSRFWPDPVPKPGINTAVVEKTEKITEHPAVIISLEEIIARVKPIWSNLLEIEDDIAPDDDFFELGGDSLTGLDLLAQLDKEFKGKFVTYEEMYSFSTLDKLCGTLHERLSQKHDTEEKQPIREVVEDAAEGREQYEKLLNTIRHNPAPEEVVLQDILITGGTGSLGSCLVKRLVDTTDANIICLVRGKNEQDASERFWSVYKESFSIGHEERIRVICGDLSDEYLFKGKAIQQSLEKVNAVYHAAGSLTFVGSPDLEKHINYEGTRHIFDWSVENKVPYFNYISTVGITGRSMPEHIQAFHETDLNLGQNTANFVHSGTKLLAEEYINDHASADTVVNTFRISNVGGRYTDGFTLFNMNRNLMYLKLLRVYKAGHYSDEFLNYSLNFQITPVDILARAICDLSFYRHQFLQTFHLTLEKGFTMEEIISSFKENKIILSKLDHNDFLEYIEKWQESSEEYAVNLMKYETYDKKTRENTYKLMTDATRLSLGKINASVTYDRLAYLNTVVSYCIKEGFLSADSSLINH